MSEYILLSVGFINSDPKLMSIDKIKHMTPCLGSDVILKIYLGDIEHLIPYLKKALNKKMKFYYSNLYTLKDYKMTT